METLTNQDSLQEIASGFGLNHPHVEPLGSGLIHYTYSANDNGRILVLQQINTKVFAHPQSLISNYLVVYNHLEKNGTVLLPKDQITSNGQEHESTFVFRLCINLSMNIVPRIDHELQTQFCQSRHEWHHRWNSP